MGQPNLFLQLKSPVKLRLGLNSPVLFIFRRNILGVLLLFTGSAYTARGVATESCQDFLHSNIDGATNSESTTPGKEQVIEELLALILARDAQTQSDSDSLQSQILRTQLVKTKVLEWRRRFGAKGEQELRVALQERLKNIGIETKTNLTEKNEQTAKVDLIKVLNPERLMTLRHERSASIQQIHLSPDGEHLVLLASNYFWQRWNFKTGVFDGGISAPNMKGALAAFAPASDQFYFFKSYQLASRRPGGELVLGVELPSEITSLGLSPDGKHLATGQSNSSIQLWKSDNFQLQDRWIAFANDLKVDHLQYSGDGKFLAASSVSGGIKVWSAANHELVFEIPGGKGTLTKFEWTPDSGNLLVGYEFVSELNAFNLASKQKIFTYEPKVAGAPLGIRKGVKDFGVAPNGLYAYANFAHGSLDIIDLSKGHPIYVIENPGRDISAVAFSPDSRWLLTGHEDGKIVFHKAYTGEVVGSFVTSSTAITKLKFSPDGETLFIGDALGTLYVERLFVAMESSH